MMHSSRVAFGFWIHLTCTFSYSISSSSPILSCITDSSFSFVPALLNKNGVVLSPTQEVHAWETIDRNLVRIADTERIRQNERCDAYHHQQYMLKKQQEAEQEDEKGQR